MDKSRTDILLIEDNAEDAGLVIRALRKNGISGSVVHLTDGETALDYLFGEGIYQGRNIRDLPKVILLDLKMPKVDGIELLRRIKGDEGTREVPVVMLTSSNQNCDIKACYRLGANSYIVKPVDFEGFVKAVAGIGHYWLQLNHCPQIEITTN
jgi:two-component system, response regulator